MSAPRRRTPRPPPGTPTITLVDIERHAMPVETIHEPAEAWLYDKGGMREKTPILLPPGTRLVNFFRDVAEIWSVKYNDPFPCDVIFPDGRFIHLCMNVQDVLRLVPTQIPRKWDAPSQKWVACE